MTDDRLEELRKDYVGKIMCIDELRASIPDVWVAVRGVEMDDECSDIIVTGEVLDITDDEHVSGDLRDYIDSLDPSVQVMRTSYNMNVGWLGDVLITKDDR